MKSIFTKLITKLIIAFVLILPTTLTTGQNFSGQWGKTNGPCIAPQAGCLNPDNILFNNTINTSTTASATANCNPLNSWTSIDYIFSAPQDLSGNNLLVTFNASVGGKFALIQLQDNTGLQTTYNLNYVLSIPQANTPYQYSVDFHPVASSTFHFTQVSKIRVMIYNAQTAGSNDATTNFTGNFTITYSSDNKKSGEVDLVPSSVNQVWIQEANNLLYNPIGSGILLGAKPSQIDPKFLFPYYSLTVKGRTNIFGNDNALEIWSNNTNGTSRHYLAMSNSTFTVSPSTGVEYSSITAGEYGTAFTPKHLVLQNFQDPNKTGNVGIGYHTSAPTEKLSVNGNIKCRQVIGTQLGWADYVFSPSYKLRSLEEVKSYIQKENHLPGIPAEQEIVENGLNMNEMMKLQMEKIEELTLYIIAQQEKINKLEKELQSLQK